MGRLVAPCANVRQGYAHGDPYTGIAVRLHCTRDADICILFRSVQWHASSSTNAGASMTIRVGR
eukprot:2741270-Rhodomonas_salina.2